MLKYIVKRILLSLLILLGVSLIIYILVRMMPADYMETKYAEQLKSGTITQEQVDQFKKDAGLYMPDGILTLTIEDDDEQLNGLVFTKNVKSVNYDRVMAENMSAHELYWGNFYTDDELWQLTLREPGTTSLDDSVGDYTIYKRAADKTETVKGTFTASSNGSAIVLSLNGLNGELTYGTNSSDENVLIFTVRDTSSPYDGQVLRLVVNDSNYQKALDGKYSVDKLVRGDWNTSDGKLLLTLDKKGNFSLFEMEGKNTVVHSGTYRVDDDDTDNNGVYDLTLGDVGTKTIEYREASFGEKTSAVLGGYFNWLWNMMRGNFGRSFTHEKPVATVIGDHMWISFIISFIALIFEFVISIPLGITSATHQYSARDYIVTIITMIGISFPSFFFAALLIKLFSSTLGWFPTTGLVSGGSNATGFVRFADMAWHLTLPMVVMVVLSIGSLMRYTRTNMLEVLSSDYIRTARAKGLSEKRVVYVHAFRNTLIPLMTMMAGILPSLFGGAMITEEVFAIDGIGRIAYKSLTQGDLPLIMGYNMFLAVLTVIGTLLSDIMYAVVDPRVKLTK